MLPRISHIYLPLIAKRTDPPSAVPGSAAAAPPPPPTPRRLGQGQGDLSALKHAPQPQEKISDTTASSWRTATVASGTKRQRAKCRRSCRLAAPFAVPRRALLHFPAVQKISRYSVASPWHWRRWRMEKWQRRRRHSSVTFFFHTLAPPLHRYLPTRAAYTASSGKSYLPTYMW